VVGDVGDGVVVEYTGFCRIYDGLPNIDGLLLDFKGFDVFSDLVIKYVLCGALVRKVIKDNFDRVVIYLSRMELEFNVMVIRDAIKFEFSIKSTRVFVEWVIKCAAVLM
jgi:hypothetical protein